MTSDEATVDALDAFAQQVLDACAPLEHMPTARLAIQARQPGAWFVVYFFGSEEALLQAVKGGDAYVVQQTFQRNIARVPSVQTASVHFEGAYDPDGEPWARRARRVRRARPTMEHGRGPIARRTVRSMRARLERAPAVRLEAVAHGAATGRVDRVQRRAVRVLRDLEHRARPERERVAR